MVDTFGDVSVQVTILNSDFDLAVLEGQFVTGKFLQNDKLIHVALGNKF